jgi:hypothetical protein
VADDNGDEGDSVLLSAVVGVLLLAVVALSFVMVAGGVSRQSADLSIEASSDPRPG